MALLPAQLQEMQRARDTCGLPLQAGTSQEMPPKLGSRGYVPSIGRNGKGVSPRGTGQKANVPVLTLTLG